MDQVSLDPEAILLSQRYCDELTETKLRFISVYIIIIESLNLMQPYFLYQLLHILIFYKKQIKYFFKIHYQRNTFFKSPSNSFSKHLKFLTPPY